MRSLILLCFLFITSIQLSYSVHADEPLSSIVNVKIPGFNEDGFLSWEIHASKVSPAGDDFFSAILPTIQIYRGQSIQSTAKTKSGNFKPKTGEAWGRERMEVTADGFHAKGENWHWFDKTELGLNQIIFKQGTMITFSRGLGGFFVFENRKSDSNCLPDDIDVNNSKRSDHQLPTIAQADYLEFMSVEENNHRFLLEGNVSVEGNNLYLTCDKIELLFVNDANGTSRQIGKINTMEAIGNVILRQGGRKSYANEMTLSVPEGIAELRGSSDDGTLARVVDEEWGEAVGEKIILVKGKRMAKVLSKSGRPRVILPPIPDLGFDKISGQKKSKP